MSLFEDEGAWKPPRPPRKPRSVRQLMGDVVVLAIFFWGLKSCKVVRYGPADGPPLRTTSVLDMYFDPNDDGKVRVLFTNNNDQVVRVVEVGPQGTLGRFGPLAKGQTGSCRIPRQFTGRIFSAYVLAEPAGDVRYPFSVDLSWDPFTDTRAITLNPDRTYGIGPGPHSTDH